MNEDDRGAAPACTALIDAPRVAEMIQMTPDYVYALCRRDEIPHLRFGRTVRFRPADIDRWLESRLRGVRVRPPA